MSNADQLELVVEMLYALALGSAVGLEREFRGHEAGIRTLGLVCLGAALFGETSAFYGDSRVAAGVVQGIGFLGAGLIIVRGGTIVGATTAVTVWAMAGIGLLASEAWLTALLLTGIIIVALEVSFLSDWARTHGRPNTEAQRLRQLAEERSARDTREDGGEG
ncbi:MAG: MgtC/SapB family protein [Tepidiformaceae bacterium]